MIGLVFLVPILLCYVFWFLGHVHGVGYILTIHVAMFFASEELQIGHVIDENLSMPKTSCFLALPMYCLVRNFSIHVFCEYDIAGLDHKLLDIALSISGFIVHLLMLGNCYDMVFRLLSRLCLVMSLSATPKSLLS
jgi:hypothetical protein